MMNRYITLDGYKYAVAPGTYIRSWARSFSSQLAANTIRINWVDRGPGVRKYNMTLMLFNWRPDSEPYKDGITQTLDEQIINLEASYAKLSTSLQFLDAFGNPPSANSGIYFENLNQIIPQYSTVANPYVLYEVELMESTQVVN